MFASTYEELKNTTKTITQFSSLFKKNNKVTAQ